MLFVTRLKLRKSAFILYRTLVSISNSEGTVKNALKNKISSKGLKMRMSGIKLSVHLTIEYTISGKVFVLILKVTAVLAKILAENHMQV